jgi:CBS domain containing-hemolysin-like protein
MIDREEIVPLSTTESLETNLDRIERQPHVRFPLVGDQLAEFVGIVYSPAVIAELDRLEAGERTLEDIATPPMTVAPETAVSDLIDQFQAENQELALVLSGGEVQGLVTTTDAFEAIAGELEDPIDERLGLGA